MKKQIKNPQVSFPGIAMVIVIAILLVKSVVLPALEISRAEMKSGSGDFEGTLELFEEYSFFGHNGEGRIQDFLVAQGDYYFRDGDYDSALSVYETAMDRGMELTEKIGETYITEADTYVGRNSYESAITTLENAELAGFDMSEKKKEVNYLWAQYEYGMRNYSQIIDCLKACGDYPGAAEMLQEVEQEIRQSYAEMEAIGFTEANRMISLAQSMEKLEIQDGVWSCSQETLAEYKDWLSVSGSRFIARKGDGTAFVYGAGADQLNVSGWSDLKGVYCYGSGAFGWSNNGTVFSTGMYSADSLGFSDIVQIVGNENRVFGLRSDGTVLCFQNGQGTYTMDVSNVKRLSMSSDGRIAMLINDGSVCYEVEAGIYDTSNTGVKDAVFSGNNLIMLYTDGSVSAEDPHFKIKDGDSILLYPSKGFVFAITDNQYAVGEYRKYADLGTGEEFTSDTPCLCIGNGDYWDLETGCIVYLTQSGDINVFYRYDHLLELKQETIFITNIFQ